MFGWRKDGYMIRECTPCSKNRKKQHDKKNPQQRYDRDKRFMDKRFAMAAERFEEWKKKTNLPFKPLAEQQWLEACSHFRGCALCDSEHIEVRQFFVNFKDGGRYTAWNVYPICGKCATKTRKIANPFQWLDRYTGYAIELGITKEIGDKLVAYLELQIEKAVKDNEQQAGSV